MKSKSLIEKQTKKKRNPLLVETIIAAKKNKNWLEVASLLTRSRRKRVQINLNELKKIAKENSKVVIPGKILSQGEFDKKMKIIAFDFSEKAKEKLLKNGCEVSSILEEIKKNPSAEGIEIIKNENN